MVLSHVTSSDVLTAWLLPARAEERSVSSRAASAYLDNRRATPPREPVQLETVASAMTETRRVYEVIPYVSHEGFSKLTGAAAYAATQNVLGTRTPTIDDYA